MAEGPELLTGELDPNPPRWRKSTATDKTDCVELASATGAMLVRDSKDRAGPVLVFSDSAWNVFRARLTAPAAYGQLCESTTTGRRSLLGSSGRHFASSARTYAAAVSDAYLHHGAVR